ncbi:hypothetical protein Y032_0071g504 [Ancylostoma ceylanicum]|uniref:Uncharacterized protein n=2 Tax=Ancylostoma ceylanicum TaxID=53326 RepID=A0A016TVW7_9BILA|nr:hypothetical protein Y032_0071g504 [Ancylostoma ceylanicum]
MLSCEMTMIFVISTTNYLCMQVFREIHGFDFGVGSGAAERMPPKRVGEEEEGGGGEEAQWPRRKAPMFNDIEARRLITLYCENRDRYHGKIKPGVRSGETDKQILLKEWSKEISSMGFATRTKAQIEEKIRNEVKKVQKHLRAQTSKPTFPSGVSSHCVVYTGPFTLTIVGMRG